MTIFRTTLIVALTILTFTVSAQNKFTTKGNEAFEKQYWFAAIDNYKIALKKEKDKELKKLITYRIAQSYEKTRDVANAVNWYGKVVKKGGGFADSKPEVYLKLANSLKKMEMYSEAMEHYMTYQDKRPDDEAGIKGAKSCELAMKWIAKPTRYLVENVKQLNTKSNDAIPNYSSKKKDEIIFQSYRKGGLGNDENNVSGEAFPDLYTSKLDRKTGQWNSPTLLPDPVNTNFAEGSPSLNSKCSILYFSRCENHEKETKGCDIYKATKKGQGYGAPLKLELFDDSSATVNSHPFINADESRLYFVSNMKGGQGGFDIWYSTWDKKEKKFINPKNLGPEINTPGHEYYPFIHADGTLYFSSNGHVGMGGFDLFKSAKEEKGFGPVTNLKVPLNSSADDASIVFDGDFERGFISSNRAGSKGLTDIWSFVLPKAEVFVEGVIGDCAGGPVANVTVLLKGSNGSLEDVTTGADGKYKFKLELGLMYTLLASSDSTYTNSVGTEFKRYFASDKKNIDVVGIEDSKTFIQDLCLEKIPERRGIELPNIVYDYNKSTLTKDAKNKLQGLISTMKDNPTIVIELGSHTDFRGSAPYNEKLAQARAQSAVDFIAKSGVAKDRMVAKGYGESVPKAIDSVGFKLLTPKQQGMFPIGTVLSEKYITGLKDKNKVEVAHQMNRRTEFKVLRTDYVAGGEGEKATPKKEK
ncbi:MAG: peptidoglycan-associated lipoprotein [Glaciecola sp.]|jgi:peptidoglycan-associated lipoprotein